MGWYWRTWGLGDLGTWGLGDLGTWGLARQSGLEGFPHRAIAEGGDLGTWGLGDLGTW